MNTDEKWVLFISYYSRRCGKISRQLVNLHSPKGGVKRRVSMRVRKQSGRDRAKLISVHVADGTGLRTVMEKIETEYMAPRNEISIGAQMELDGHRESWLNPDVVPIFEKIEDARAQKTIVENNGGKQSLARFWGRLEKLRECDLGVRLGVNYARAQLVVSELGNFTRGFDVRI